MEVFLHAFVALFVTIDPIGILPIFLGLTAAAGRRHQIAMALRASIIAFVVLLGFALGGEWLLVQLGITLPAFRVAGGVLLFLIALEMLFERRGERRQRSVGGGRDHAELEDISVFPLGIPLICGPGAIAAIMLLASEHAGDWGAQGTVLAALSAVMLLTFLLLALAVLAQRWISPTVTAVVTRLLGMLLAALAVQYIFDGLREGLLGTVA
jgi:multiple antibiotic resistance protein